MGFGGGAASAALLWGLWEFRRWPRMPGKERPVIAECCAYAEYDGWLVTTEDKRRLPFALAYTSGWYSEETAPENPGQFISPLSLQLNLSKNFGLLQRNAATIAEFN